MVTSVNMSEQIAYAVKSANEQKDKGNKTVQSIAKQEKASQKAEVLISQNMDDIEDNYIPSEDLNKMGVDYYNKHWDSGFGNINHSCSLEEFTNSLRKQITDAYDKDHPDSNCAMPPSVSSYLDSIDYKKEYEEYKQSRGCATDEELKALNSVPCVKTKDDLLDFANSYMFGITYTLQDNGFLSQEPFDDKVNPSSVIKQLNLQDVADYLNAQQSTHNFKEHVSVFKSFADLISKQDNLDLKTRNIFALLSQDITNAKGAIDAFSDEIERVNAQGLSAKSQYNATLIAQYDS